MRFLRGFLGDFEEPEAEVLRGLWEVGRRRVEEEESSGLGSEEDLEEETEATEAG